ncbi:MAG TPA: M48 family metallopeptidase [Thermoanaerobaculia bacterium]|jgi:STE24 endopeptidase|nr:M48 family metallopeptidase [Thermoanaerobaculia bacterium]
MKSILTRAILSGLALLVLAAAAMAQAPAASAATTETARFDAQAATDAYMATLSPEKRARSDAYFEGGYWLTLWDLLYGLGVAWILLGTRLSARMRDLAERLTRFRPLQTFLYALQYILATALLSLPLGIYEGFFREHQYGLSNQTFAAWAGEWLKGIGLGLVLGGLALTALYAVLRKAPRTWWLWGALVSLLFLVVGIALGPVYIEPIFNQYTELRDPTLRDPILSLARANGIPAEHVYVVDASKQTKRVSANVAGLFGTTRIALNDNLLHRTSPAGVKAVMGHEMGHYVLHHVSKSILFFGVVLVAGFAFMRWAFDRAAARWGETWGLRGVADPAGLPLLLTLFSLYGFVLTPLINTHIRMGESEADIFGLNAAREPDGFAEVALQLSEYRKLDPGPVEEWIFFDHPSGRNRISMAMRWKAEQINGRSPAP